MNFSGPLQDRIAIRETIEAYADAVFRRDADAWAQNWADDSVWNLAGTEVSEKNNIVELWSGAMSGFSFVAFFAQTGAIHVDGDNATARSYTIEDLVQVDGKSRHIVGQYDDTLQKQNARWVFTRRIYKILSDA